MPPLPLERLCSATVEAMEVGGARLTTSAGGAVCSPSVQIKLTLYSPQGQQQPPPWMITMPRSRMAYTQSSPNGEGSTNSVFEASFSPLGAVGSSCQRRHSCSTSHSIPRGTRVLAGVACPPRCQSGRLPLTVTPQMDDHLNQHRDTLPKEACPRRPREPHAAAEWATDVRYQPSCGDTCVGRPPHAYRALSPLHPR